MFRPEELFCAVDDFCQTFEPLWKQQLLGCGLKLRQRERSLSLSEIMTILLGFPSVVLPQLQNLLSSESAGGMGGSISRISQLSTLSRMGADYFSADVRLFALVFG